LDTLSCNADRLPLTATARREPLHRRCEKTVPTCVEFYGCKNTGF